MKEMPNIKHVWFMIDLCAFIQVSPIFFHDCSIRKIDIISLIKGLEVLTFWDRYRGNQNTMLSKEFLQVKISMKMTHLECSVKSFKNNRLFCRLNSNLIVNLPVKDVNETIYAKSSHIMSCYVFTLTKNQSYLFFQNLDV